jgi:hypothetical protein
VDRTKIFDDEFRLETESRLKIIFRLETKSGLKIIFRRETKCGLDSIFEGGEGRGKG